MDVFDLRKRVIDDYRNYVEGFIKINDQEIEKFVQGELNKGILYPDPLIQLNPLFKPGKTIEELVSEGLLHQECESIFRVNKSDNDLTRKGHPLRLHQHQEDALRTAKQGKNYVLTTGTASGKSLAYIVPIVDHVLRVGHGRGVKAIVVYPMNALANSQEEELRKYLVYGYGKEQQKVTFKRYTGQDELDAREALLREPPDILLTNYVMLEFLLIRPFDKRLIEAAANLQFLVFDELHTYRGRQGADVAYLIRRVRDRVSNRDLQCIGTSATIAGTGTFEDQQVQVADFASKIFGVSFDKASVIGETIQRKTPDLTFTDPNELKALTQQILNAQNFKGELISSPLASWIESAFGVESEPGSQRLRRTKPMPINGPSGAADQLSRLTNLSVEQCSEAIRDFLIRTCSPEEGETNASFAFKLHQFVGRGDTVYASLDLNSRYLSLRRQRYVPGSRDKVLFPIVFCRECGHEYYSVTRSQEDSQIVFEPRDPMEPVVDKENSGYLYLSKENPWPISDGDVLERLPEDWIEETNRGRRVKSNFRRYLPEFNKLNLRGETDIQGTEMAFVSSPFRFCLNCGVAYRTSTRTDFSSLATIASEGRSSATTVMCMAITRYLKERAELSREAKKVLSFIDNRQDAAFQSGHFNDFVEIALLRSSIFKAVSVEENGIKYDVLPRKVFEALNLDKSLYAANPDARFQAEKDAQSAFCNVLGYKIYLDLRRGWRLTSPNLEQCDLLRIEYPSLKEVCEAEDIWKDKSTTWANVPQQDRQEWLRALLDWMRRELAIKVEFLSQEFQERMLSQSAQFLIPPWGFDDQEEVSTLEKSKIAIPSTRSNAGQELNRDFVYASAMSGFGKFLKRESRRLGLSLSKEEAQRLIQDLFDIALIGGMVDKVLEDSSSGVVGYQLQASSMLWKAGPGERSQLDPLRVSASDSSSRKPNSFFLSLYREAVDFLTDMRSDEHTAQVPYELREDREKRFREGTLPVLFCSPTMELGVDIAQLNVVNMRNVPPTPANYAQRSGRAGRSGQPAFVLTYCTIGSNHDQYYFNRPDQMVSGSVNIPRIDLTNEDLVRAHAHAIWLAETGADLGKSLSDVLSLEGSPPSLQLLESMKETLSNPHALYRARESAKRVFKDLKAEWYSNEWLEQVLQQARENLDRACQRWRDLYRAAQEQQAAQNAIVTDATRSQEQKDAARRLRAEAEAQIQLLLETEKRSSSDFYSYRYFASEGFLPGYSFTRLPLSVYLPGRLRKKNDDYLSRPRFIAITEFGPRAIVYHEGLTYEVDRVTIPANMRTEANELPLGRMKLCNECGYLHYGESVSADLCDNCGVTLPASISNLFRLQNAVARRRQRITSDEEERRRLGFDIRSGVRFDSSDRRASRVSASGKLNDDLEIYLEFGQTATLWRINYGERRRRNSNLYGFILDLNSGAWLSEERAERLRANPMRAAQVKTVIPYVEDRRNCLLLKFSETPSLEVMATLQAALKNAIQARYQLEDNELAAEPLPNDDQRNQLLFYEAAEGGAGVLRQLVEDEDALMNVAKEALALCHFDPDTGGDLGKAEHATEPCEAACPDCLLNYYNQWDHAYLDRKAIRDWLLMISSCKMSSSPTVGTKVDHFAKLIEMAGSQLEQEWLQWLNKRGYRLPSQAQPYIESCRTRPDFLYDRAPVAAIYIDGSPHDFADRQERDKMQQECLEDNGYLVIRFHHQENWETIVKNYPTIFGVERS